MGRELKRTWGLDVLDCPTCHTRMEVISAIEDEHVAARILRHLGLPTTAPPRGKPWSRQRALALDRRADQSADPPSAFE